jgi:hypothetical protein
MRPITLIAALLILAGVAGLAFNSFSFSTTEEVAKVGPLTASTETEHRVVVPLYAGVAAIVLGGALLIVGLRRT